MNGPLTISPCTCHGPLVMTTCSTQYRTCEKCGGSLANVPAATQRMSDEELQHAIDFGTIGGKNGPALVAEARRAREAEERLQKLIKDAPHAGDCAEAAKLRAALEAVIASSTEERTPESYRLGCSRCMGHGADEGGFFHDADCPVFIARAALAGAREAEEKECTLVCPPEWFGHVVAEARRARETEERLRKTIEDAAHDYDCSKIIYWDTRRGSDAAEHMRIYDATPCNCWKGRALAPQEKK